MKMSKSCTLFIAFLQQVCHLTVSGASYELSSQDKRTKRLHPERFRKNADLENNTCHYPGQLSVSLTRACR